MVKLRQLITDERNAFVMTIWRLSLVFLLFSFQRIVFYRININFFPEISRDHLFELLVSGLKFDLSAILYINSLYLLLMLLPWPFKYNESYKKAVKILFLVSNGIAFASNFADVVYFRYILRRADFGIFTEFHNERNLFQIVGTALIDNWLLLLILGLMMGFLYVLYFDHRPGILLKSKWKFYAVTSIFALLFAGLTVAGMRGGFTGTTRPITISNSVEKIKKPIEAAIVLNTPFSLMQTIESQTLSELHTFDDKEIEKIYTPLHAGNPPGEFRQLNVVVLILESFKKELFGSLNKDLEKGQYKGYTPFLDSLISKSYTWKYSFANGMKSIDAIPSVIAGIPSLVQPFILSRYSLNDMEGLAATLKLKGYDSGFFHGAPNGSMGFSAMTNMLSINKYFGLNEYGRPEDFDGYWGVPDELFLNYCANTFGTLKEPFLASVFTLSSHHPYILPKKYEHAFKGGPNPLYKCVEYSDYSLKEFFKEASTKPWYKNTLFVLTADHSLPSEEHEEYKTSIGLFSVPVIFHQPGSSLIGMDTTLVQQIDIFPTVLGYLKYDAPYFAFGNDRFNPNEKPFVINYVNEYFQFMEGDYLVQSDGKKPLAIYRYKEDRLLQHNLIEKQDSLFKPHFQRFQAFLQQYNNRMVQDRLTIKPKN